MPHLTKLIISKYHISAECWALSEKYQVLRLREIWPSAFRTHQCVPDHELSGGCGAQHPLPCANPTLQTVHVVTQSPAGGLTMFVSQGSEGGWF